MAELISQREFARRVKVSEGMIRKAIDNGWIINGRTTRPSGTPALFYEIALDEWNKSPGGLKAPGILPQKDTKTLPKSASTAPESPAANSKTITINPEVSAEKLEMMAKRNKSIDISTARQALALQKEQNKLVDKEKSYSAFFDFGKMLRENLTLLPSRLTQLIRSAATDREGQDIFAKGIEEVLQNITTPPDLTAF